MHNITSIATYLRQFASELGDRILESFPPLHGVNDPPSPMIHKLLRKPYPAQTQAIMGLVLLWEGAGWCRDCGMRHFPSVGAYVFPPEGNCIALFMQTSIIRRTLVLQTRGDGA